MNDLIKRMDALVAIRNLYPAKPKIDFMDTISNWRQKNRQYMECERAIEELPSAEPEQKKGEWIHGRELSREMIGNVITAIFYEGWECSECHCLVQEEREPLWKYCPYCGAKMEKGEDDAEDD